jgi:ATP-dependent Clp protease ATP-binding subunit ClpA
VFERFTERARHVVVLAQEEARTLHHNFIGTEHILLGLLREDEGRAARVLQSLGVSLEQARSQVARLVSASDELTSGQIPFTPRAKKVLELALREALALGDNYIGTAHILLGLVREGDGVAARVLLGFDAEPERIRNAVIALLPDAEAQEQGRATAAVRMSEFTVTVAPDPALRRLLRAAAGHALGEGRDEFSLADLLAVAEQAQQDKPQGDQIQGDQTQGDSAQED